ncbi:solute carrier family 2, facilitated glucose transporter member 6 isoform X2 [Balaenoptera musculus]|uniref:Solute carrier family 2, facilitated glucose transporter member 6 isoform X2 n=1 Tax=Balaenoptera musculus TaxID=9771 RepID=A0A8B8XPU6_BALMU|nr:solute carrier family 2, facilitated glucose transporter member 6 isoform X2 [Balaenoptera musculus]
MQEPLLGAEAPDYDTFPEKPPPSPGERTRVGALQNKKVFLATFAAVLGNFSFGYALVYTSPVIPALEHSLDPNLSLTKTQASWFGSVFTLGAAAGGLSAMVLNDLLGRKLSIMFSAVPSAAGYALMAGAHGLWMLLLGRTLTGFAGGLTAACIPVYVSEIAPAGVRGALGATPQLMAVFGSLSLYALGTRRRCRHWPGCEGLTLTSAGSSSRSRTTSGDSHLSWAEARDPHVYRPIVIALLMRFLQQLTGITPILVYLQSIFDSTAVLLPPEDDAAIVGAVRLLSVLIAALTMDLAGRKALLFVSGEHRLLTGTHSLLQQLPRALPALAVGAPGGLGQTCPGGLRLPSNRRGPRHPERSAGARGSKRAGGDTHAGCDRSPNAGWGGGSWLPCRKQPPVTGGLKGTGPHGVQGAEGAGSDGPGPPSATCLSTAASMFAANLTLGLYVHFGPKPLTPNGTMGLESVPPAGTEQPLATPTGYLTLVPLLATMLFIMGYAMGWGPITWLLMSEILPLRARGVASGLCVLVSWLTAFALTKSFLLVVNAFGLQVPFFFFAAVCSVNLAFTGCCVPETKGRSLEQIEAFFRSGRRSFLR